MPTSTSTSAESSGNNVPAFLSKLWRLVEDPKYDSVISWSDSGQSFTIHDQTQFAKDVLPLYFKHNNMASFIRQLNMYGFRKVVNVDSGGLKGYKEDIEFYHNYFIRGQESTLEYIKRKAPGHQKVRYRALPTPQEIPTTTTSAISAVPNDQELRTELVRELLTDVNQLQGKQEKVDTQLVEMKRENEALWREVAVLRRKHLKQQRIVEKLIHFLARLVHQARSGNPENNISMKRKHTLMLDEGGRNRKILRGPVVPNRQTASPETRISEIDSGPIISDITYEQPANDPRYNAVPAGGGKSTTLTIAPPDTAASPVVDALITFPANATDLTDEVVLCENLFDEDVDLAPCVESAVSGARNPFQSQQQTVQQQSGRQLVQELEKFDLDQTLNTPRVDWEDHHNPIPGTSSKQLLGQLMTSNTGAAAGLQVALQSPNKNAFETESSLGKNKDAFGESKSSFLEDSPSRLDSKAVTEWQGCRHTIAQNLSSMLSDYFNGAEQIKRIEDDANSPPETLNDHLEGVETELDWLQQQLTAGGLNIDNSTLLNIFNTDLADFTDDNSGANSNSM